MSSIHVEPKNDKSATGKGRTKDSGPTKELFLAACSHMSNGQYSLYG